MTGLSEEEKEGLSQGLPGSSLMPLLDASKESVRDGVLFCYESLLMSAIQVEVGPELSMTTRFALSSRGMVRGLITKDYKFVRYFSPLEFHIPTTLEELNNLAADPEANGELILALNAQLNELIAQEIGQDDGQEVAAVLQAIQASGLAAGS